MADLVGNPNCWFCHTQAQMQMQVLTANAILTVIMIINEHAQMS